MAFWGEFSKGWRAVVLGEKEVSQKDPSSETVISHICTSVNHHLTPKQKGLSLLISSKSPGSIAHLW